MGVNPDPITTEGPGKSKGANRRRWEVLVILILLGALGLLFFQTHFSTWKIEAPFPNNLLIASLIGLNILLLLLFVYLILRDIARLIFERKRKALGAKLKTKLVVAFITLTLVPTILLFVISTHFITSTIESWFGAQVEGSQQESLVVGQMYYQDQAGNALNHARHISQFITQQRLLGKGNQDPLSELLKAKRAEYNLGALEIISPQSVPLLLFRGPSLEAVNFPPMESKVIQEVLREKRPPRSSPSGRGI